MLLAVDVDGDTMIADVGFGADGLLLPVPLGAAAPTAQFAWTYRVIAERDGTQVMQSLANGDWRDLYAFTLEPQLPVDFDVANWYTSTHPQSRFVQIVTAQRLSPDKRITLRDLDLIEDDGRTTSTRHLGGREERRRILVEIFGIELPADVELPD